MTARPLAHALAFGALAVGVASTSFASADPPPAPARTAIVYGADGSSARAGDYTVYYSAVPSTQLSVEVAQRYGIARSSNRALLNVSVTRGPRAAEAVPVKARVEATAVRGNGERQVLNVREIRTLAGVSYLGEASIDERDSLDIALTVTPEGGAPIAARFRQEFWPAARR